MTRAIHREMEDLSSHFDEISTPISWFGLINVATVAARLADIGVRTSCDSLPVIKLSEAHVKIPIRTRRRTTTHTCLLLVGYRNGPHFKLLCGPEAHWNLRDIPAWNTVPIGLSLQWT